MLEGLSDWWDSVELWLAQLWFPVQFILVMAVLLPLCAGLAWLIDRLVDRVSRWLSSGRS
ncbi:hypothetical protein [Amycolatopsis magusensis]|uniref:Elongation factor P--beta-lysine ligase n=1 Tax=Amycolatopsis magusensis TaxID=882444 RepID=A0ABS4PRM8_9PSEU|nr:hypothetical protein [Amycolatopsis magusensis]MBP2181524.1 elongation factor P--beta-lysine ligase [Amycolatopsis magusensis]MDI5979755.1 hypothetical protein [Amycolatopsis magusensis]UJW32249.1 hypothetical protein L3Q67_00195 [Saccharothrix sp. AJ9571]